MSKSASATSAVTLHSILSSQDNQQWTILYLLLPLLTYLLLVRTLRHSRLNRLQRTCPPSTHPTMSLATAQQIILTLPQFEFPFMFEKGLQFALFRTYAIPTISSLLASTNELSDLKKAPKRYADTVAIVSVFLDKDVGSEEWVKGVARMNCIHDSYQRTGRIKEEDMLYTLALFATQPKRWIEKWDWRELSEVEDCALGVYWKAVGDAQGISYSPLPSSATGWKSGTHWLQEISTWADKYELEFMVPAQSNHITAVQTIEVLLYAVPQFLKPYGRTAVLTLMDPLLRTAMIYPKPPDFATFLVSTLLRTRAFIIRYLCLPRPSFLRVDSLTPSQDGKYHMIAYDAEPWYVKPTLMNRWGMLAWWRWAQGLPIPGDEGERFCPMGFGSREIGPTKVGRGKGEQEAMEGKIKGRLEEAMGKCPMGNKSSEKR